MAMSPRWQSLIRLLGVQAAWTYERMSGIGVGHAAAPLLRDLYRESEPLERRAAVARSAEYFNSHPYLAGVAVGAVVRAERDGVPGAVISRLRTALSGPLGALGDQLTHPEIVARINLGGIHHRPGREERLRYLYLDAAELALVDLMQSRGAVVTAQDLPTAVGVDAGSLR